MKRRTFLAAMGAAGAATICPSRPGHAASSEHALATVIDMNRCNGCQGLERPACVTACRIKNRHRFPEPDPAMLKDYWPKKYHEDWSSKRDITWRLTPYNWLFVEEVYLEDDKGLETLYIPRRCMHCDNPPCVKLCPFGTAQKDSNGPVHIDPALCFGGAKCRAVCPWHVPQRQTGVGIYTSIDPMPIGAGVMYKCDLCRDRLAEGNQPACMESCPQKAMHIGPRSEMQQLAKELARKCGGELYGLNEHGGTSTYYVSSVPFSRIDAALTEEMDDTSRVMRFHQPDNAMNRGSNMAKAALLAPLAGAIGAFAATAKKRENRDE